MYIFPNTVDDFPNKPAKVSLNMLGTNVMCTVNKGVYGY